ncbi:MAG TPA: carbonic anhydrase [Acidimicrobiales bacterium]|nr:carbonic anhydrase [Acidimicrobiales bacterium]
MGKIDDLIANNAAYASSFELGALEPAPTLRVAVVACMDARLDPAKALGLNEGDAHVMRNAGGSITEDMLRSLAVSQWMLGTEEVVLVHHTGCGMEGLPEQAAAQRVQGESGTPLPFSLGAFDSAEDDLREGLRKVRDCPYLRSHQVRGFMYEVETGRVREVQA